MHWAGGVSSRGGVCQGCLPRGVSAGGVFWGVSAGGVSQPSGGVSAGGVSQHAIGQIPPPPVDRQTPVKT